MKKIIVLGAGQVGSAVAENLVAEANDVVVIDRDEKKLRELSARLDLRTVTGNAGHPSVLIDAGIEDCELLIAVTEIDEVNMIACKIAASLFGVPDRIARIRANEYLDDKRLSGEELFAINQVICPEQLLADQVTGLVNFPEALQVLEFANGLVSLVAVHAHAGGMLVGSPISSLGQHLKTVDARIVAIFRKNAPLAPVGETVIESGDEVFFLSRTADMRQVMQELRKMDRPVKKIMISGGSEIGLRLARSLEKNYQVKLIEANEDRAKELAALLENTLVLRGEENKHELLREENISEVDLFIATNRNNERNIIASLLAKRMGAHRVISVFNQQMYVNLLEGSNIDIVIGVPDVTIGSILSHVRRADVTRVHSLRRGAAEALEIVVHGDKTSSKCVGRRVNEIDWPAGTLLGAIIREEQVLMAHHDVLIEAGDHLILFLSEKKMVSKIERLLQVSGFLL
jgi:trk system potassium uptake protein TrkA